MSFVAPGAARLIARWAETAAWAAAGLGAALWALGALHDPAWRWGLAAAALALGFWFARAAALSALAARDEARPGVVVIDERRIVYLGPETGGVASLNELAAIEVRPGRDGPDWALHGPPEAPGVVLIPAGAEGAAGLPDAFAALPGFAPGRALAALADPGPAGRVVWRRRGAAPDLALAPRRA